jgi:hypothetical protein
MKEINVPKSRFLKRLQLIESTRSRSWVLVFRKQMYSESQISKFRPLKISNLRR